MIENSASFLQPGPVERLEEEREKDPVTAWKTSMVPELTRRAKARIMMSLRCV